MMKRAILFSVGLIFSLYFVGQRGFADLYVSAASANSVMRFDGATGAFLGNFVAPGAGGLSDPQGIAFGPDGHLYVASNGSDNVLKFDGQTGAFLDVAASDPSFRWPAEINFRDGYLYVSDFQAGHVSRFHLDTGGADIRFATDQLAAADGQSWDSRNRLYVSDFAGAVERYDGETGAFLDQFIPLGSGIAGALDNLFLPNGDFLVSSFNTNRLSRYTADGDFIEFVPLPRPQGLQIGPDGLLYAGSFSTGQIFQYDPDTLDQLGLFADAASTTNNFVFRVPEPQTGWGPILCLMLVWRRRKVWGGAPPRLRFAHEARPAVITAG